MSDMQSNRFSGLMSSPPAEGGCGPTAAAETDAGASPLQPRRCTPSSPAQAPPCRRVPPPPALPAVSAFREGSRSHGERNLDADLIAFFEGFNHLKSRDHAIRPVEGNIVHLHGVTAAAGGRKECTDPDVKDIYIDVDRTRRGTSPAPDPDANPGQGGQVGTGADGGGAGGVGGGGAGGAPGGGAGGSPGGDGGEGGEGGNYDYNLAARFVYRQLLLCRCQECQRRIAGWICRCQSSILCTECRSELRGRPGILCPYCNTEVEVATDFELAVPDQYGMMTAYAYRR